MTDFEIDAVHKCGHTERITGSTTGTVAGIRKDHADMLCSVCKPTCRYCRRSGLRENMLVTGGKAYCNDWCLAQTANPTHYREWNTIEIPAFLRHWDDCSYHNDLLARSMYDVDKHTVTVWVEHDKVEDREDPLFPKYSISFDPEGQYDDAQTILYQGEDASEAAEWVSAAEIVACGPDSDDAPGAAAKAETLRQIVAKANAK